MKKMSPTLFDVQIIICYLSVFVLSYGLQNESFFFFFFFFLQKYFEKKHLTIYCFIRI